MTLLDAVRAAIVAETEGLRGMAQKVATIECPVCDAWVEIYPTGVPGQHKFGWNARDDAMCKTPPLQRCQFMGREIERSYPGCLNGGVSN